MRTRREGLWWKAEEEGKLKVITVMSAPHTEADNGTSFVCGTVRKVMKSGESRYRQKGIEFCEEGQ